MATAKQDLKITYRDPGELKPYARNAKKHEPAQITQIIVSIQKFGFNNPILLDGKNGIVAGHGRWEAAQQMGLSKVPTVDLSHLNATQKRAYILADNRLAEVNTSWDFSLVSEELKFLDEKGMDFSVTGFTEGFLMFGNSAVSGSDSVEYGDDDLNPAHTCPECGHAFG